MNKYDEMIGKIRQLTIWVFNRLYQKNRELAAEIVSLKERVAALEAHNSKQDYRDETELLNQVETLEEIKEMLK